EVNRPGASEASGAPESARGGPRIRTTKSGREDPKKDPPRGSPRAAEVNRPRASEASGATESGRGGLIENVRGGPSSLLPGVGKRTAEKLAARGLACIEDLAYLLPLGYEDRRCTVALQDVEEGVSVVVDAVIRSFRQGWHGGRYMATLRVEQTQTNGARLGLEARWFHPVGGLGQRVTTGQRVLLAGVIKRFREKLSMVHPDVLDPESGLGIAVRYPVIEGVGQRTIQRLCRAAVERLRAAALADPLPAELVEKHGLI